MHDINKNSLKGFVFFLNFIQRSLQIGETRPLVKVESVLAATIQTTEKLSFMEKDPSPGFHSHPLMRMKTRSVISLDWLMQMQMKGTICAVLIGPSRSQSIG